MNLLANALIATLRSPLSKYSSAKLEDFGIAKKLSYVKTLGAVGFAFAPEMEYPDFLPTKETFIRELFKRAWTGAPETSLALAALSAITQKWIDDGGEVEMPAPDLVEALGIDKGMKVLMIGYMAGVVEEVKEAGAEVVLYEDNYMLRCSAKDLGVKAYPGSYALLEEEADAIIATGSSLLDPRIAFVFDKVKAPVKALVGPTATVHPYFARLIGATHVGGSYVPPEKREEVLGMIKMGYGYKRLVRSGLIQKWFART
ncbi:hypothetical protein IPA_08170 [Ignicoccus pacificus DSM 13166]|uniref:Putative heavy-metal chelation domain-containing protein n=1 Tax=Ignicoccus pacificus DSM 13166 TaxID=940294 RepID=A0A977KBR9_9CREN|nr:hypothetical protein IPA_08170 [Ignicoccus pacificus DSM 13166]